MENEKYNYNIQDLLSEVCIFLTKEEILKIGFKFYSI